MQATKRGRVRHQNALVQPVLKWAGGKRQLLPAIRPLIPNLGRAGRYFEPFLGGGAVLFDLMPKRAVVNDITTELINCYLMIRDFPEELLEHTQTHLNTSEYFYQIREQDRSPKYGLLSQVERASRLLYLNKTCYNGLFRVNSQGQFNVPFGDYKNPLVADPAVVRAVSEYFRSNEVTFRNEDFAAAVRDARKGDFVYFDPPYDPVTDTSFTGYSLVGFRREDQRRLKEICDQLGERGVRVLVSNSDTDFIRELYSSPEYTIHTVKAKRSINSDAASRGQIDELLISNYELL